MHYVDQSESLTEFCEHIDEIAICEGTHLSGCGEHEFAFGERINRSRIESIHKHTTNSTTRNELTSDQGAIQQAHDTKHGRSEILVCRFVFYRGGGPTLITRS